MLRVGLAVAWPVALATVLAVTIAPFGFNVVDEGLVLSYSQRMLDGQVPHSDFVSPRPIGSSLLHMADLVPPFPEVLTSRTIGLLVIVAYSVMFGAVAFGRAPWRWSVPESAGCVAAALVNLNTFPPMPWYTADGLLLVGCGAALLLAGRAPRSAMIALGAAATVKQSFAPAIVLGAALVVWRTRSARSGAHALALGCAPGLLYIASIAVLGAGGDMLDQFAGAEPVWGDGALGDGVAVVPLLLLVATWGASRLPSPAGRAAPLLATATLGLAAWAMLETTLEWQGDWGAVAVQSLIAVVALRFLFERVVDEAAIVTLAAAWMAALSYGLPNANLIAGSVALLVADRVLRHAGAGLPPRVARAGLYGITVAATAATVLVFADARTSFTYADRPRDELTVSLERLSPELDGIRTSAVTAAYLEQVRTCTARHPARHVVIYPDNPGLYALLDLRNPLPIDWFWPPDYGGARSKLFTGIARMDREGDFLVMFQTVLGEDLPKVRALPAAAPAVPATFRDGPLARALTGLDGRVATCGSFYVIWRPAVS